MSVGEMLYTNVFDDIMAVLKTWYGHANDRSQKDVLHENNLKASF